MELEEMFTMQKGLDDHIKENHGLEHEDVFDRKVLALLVEVGEFANETRCFKYWSLKPSSPMETVLEEFVDGIHFILSLGLECGFESIKEIHSVGSHPLSVSEQFLKVYQSIMNFRTEPTLNAYKQMFSDYLFLGSLLGIHDKEIKEAYISKNEVNYKRQEEGY
jgi:dimeric dUTPase (all-alpha-NTP-PPase superfamily)